MLFTSPEFLFAFLPLVYVVFLALRRTTGHGAAVGWLTLSSMVFYAWWSATFLSLLIAFMCLNYGAGRAIENSAGARRAALASAAILFNLALLFYFKYANFFLDVAADLGVAPRTALQIVLPLGISFFTFQKIAYIADIYSGHARSAPFLDFALFVFFFPQLIAGPIVHHAQVTPQYERLGEPGDRRSAASDLAIGLTLVLIGLFKKVVIADQIARYAAPAFAPGAQELGALIAWQGALCYTVQLYFDFSGYSDMAIGLARMFGVRFPANFDSPYRATDIIAFWRRWHITLSRFLRDYVYIPLGGNRAGPARRYVNLFITMLVGGLWHGAGWTFVVWGALHGAYLLVNHAWRATPWRLPAPIAWMITMAAVVVAWVLFRAPDIQVAGAVLAGMTGVRGVTTPALLAQEAPLAVLAALALLGVCVASPNSQQILRAFAPVLGSVAPPGPLQGAVEWRPTRRWAIAFGLVAAAVVLLAWRPSEFLYFNF